MRHVTFFPPKRGCLASSVPAFNRGSWFQMGSSSRFWLLVTLLACLPAFLVGQAWGQPTVNAVSVKNEMTFSHGNILVISGSGFGSKRQAAPVLFDHGSHAWENGERNNHQESFQDMQLVQRVDEDSGTVWTKPSLPDDYNSGMRVAKSRALRTPFSTAHYYAFGNNNFLGWPTAHGGTAPPGNPKRIYASWWAKAPFDLRYYWAIPADANPTKFITGNKEQYGEEVTVVGTSITGKIVSHDTGIGGSGIPQGWLFIEFPGASTAELRGKIIRGRLSNAEIQFPESSSTSGFSADGYLAQRGKWARFWDMESGTGFRFSIGSTSVSSSATQLYYNSARSPTPGAWNLWEVQLDIGSSPKVILSLNGEVILTGNSAWSKEVFGSNAPTIALLGMNDMMSRPFSIELDDIYLDTTFQRVLLANAKSLKDATVFELQRPQTWADTSIEVEINLGALAAESQVYAFVFDENGVPNFEGVPACDECGNFPGPPEDVGVQ